MEKYEIRREVVEFLTVFADSEEEAEVIASETPIADWDRDVKDTLVFQELIDD